MGTVSRDAWVPTAAQLDLALTLFHAAANLAFMSVVAYAALHAAGIEPGPAIRNAAATQWDRLRERHRPSLNMQRLEWYRQAVADGRYNEGN